MPTAPPLARRFVLEELECFDDEALETFLAPGEAGVDPIELGVALTGRHLDNLCGRIVRALPPEAAAAMAAARSAHHSPSEVRAARRHTIGALFWALLYWCRPETYEELVGGEDIAPGLLDALPLDDALVADLGCGAGRMTLAAARRARAVIAVDAVPGLLDRLQTHVTVEALPVETRRGTFERLPLMDGEVDVAVACSSLTSRAPFGGDAALAEAVRIVRPGGQLWVLWPDDAAWFERRGFRIVRAAPTPGVRFASPEDAVRLCRDFYGARAAHWAEEHGTAVIPWNVIGVRPLADACVLELPTTSAVAAA